MYISTWFRYVPTEQIIECTDGEVNVIEDPILKLAEDLQIKPVGDDNLPVRGAKVELRCGPPGKIHDGIEQSDGTYIFVDAIPARGTEQCELTVEKEG